LYASSMSASASGRTTRAGVTARYDGASEFGRALPAKTSPCRERADKRPHVVGALPVAVPSEAALRSSPEDYPKVRRRAPRAGLESGSRSRRAGGPCRESVVASAGNQRA
jgi:hypothetical protein